MNKRYCAPRSIVCFEVDCYSCTVNEYTVGHATYICIARRSGEFFLSKFQIIFKFGSVR